MKTTKKEIVGGVAAKVATTAADKAKHGYEQHASVEAACAAWGLVPYVDPEAEELSTIE